MSRAFIVLAFGLFAFACTALGAATLSSSEPLCSSSEPEQPRQGLLSQHAQSEAELTPIIEDLNRLDQAIRSNDLDSARAVIQSLLLKSPEHINTLDNHGNSLLHYVVDEDNLDMAEIFLKEAGASPFVPNTEDRSSLSYARSVEMLKMLLDYPDFDTVSAAAFIDKAMYYCDADTIQLIPFSERYEHYRKKESLRPRRGETVVFPCVGNLEGISNLFRQWKKCRPTAETRWEISTIASTDVKIDRSIFDQISSLSEALSFAGVAATREETGAFAAFITAHCILNNVTCPKLMVPDLLSVRVLASVLTNETYFKPAMQRAYIEELWSLLDVKALAKLLTPVELHRSLAIQESTDPDTVYR